MSLALPANTAPVPGTENLENPEAVLGKPIRGYLCYFDWHNKSHPNGRFLAHSNGTILRRESVKELGGLHLPLLDQVCAACAGSQLKSACNLKIIELSGPVKDWKGQFTSVGIERFDGDPDTKERAISEHMFGPEP